jgi:hypothetical protein
MRIGSFSGSIKGYIKSLVRGHDQKLRADMRIG